MKRRSVIEARLMRRRTELESRRRRRKRRGLTAEHTRGRRTGNFLDPVMAYLAGVLGMRASAAALGARR